MTTIADEVAHAGFGVGIDVNGLDKLVKADSVFNHFRENAERMHQIETTVNAHVNGGEDVNSIYKRMSALNGHNFTSNVDVHTSGENSLEQMRRDIDQTKNEVNHLNHAMDLDVHFNSGNGGMAELNNQVSRIRRSMTDMGNESSSSFGKLNRSAENAKTKATTLADTGMKLHGIFSGTFLGNSANQGFQSLETGMKTAIKSGIQLVETGDQVKSAWQHIGVGNRNANDMVEQMDHLRDASGMDEESIQRMQRSLYTLTGSAPRARSLTNEMVAFGKASGDSSDQIGRMGRTLPRLLSTSKVRATMFNRTLGQSPALVNAIAKASGHTKQSFMALVQSGKLTSQQLQQYMQRAAKGSGHAMDQYYSTLKGQIQAFKGMWTSAKEDFSKPFVSNLSRAINQTEHSAGGLRQLQTTVSRLSTTLGRHVGNYMGRAIGWIIKNRKPLISIGSSLFRILKAIGSGVWKEFTSILTGITGGSKKSGKSLNNFSKTLSKVASHTKQLQRFGRVLANLWIIGKIHKYTKAVRSLLPNLSKLKITRTVSRMQKGLNSSWKYGGQVTARLKANTIRLANATKRLRHPILMAKSGYRNLKTSLFNLKATASITWDAAKMKVKAYRESLQQTSLSQKLIRAGLFPIRMGITGISFSLKGVSLAMKSIPIVGWIQIAIDGISEIYMHSAKFRHLVNPLLRFIGKAIGWIGDKIADSIEGIIKFARGVGNVASKVMGFFHHTKSASASTSSSMNRYTRNSSRVYKNSQRSNTESTRRAHRSIDRYRRNSSHQFRAYISKSGRLYKNYHKGTTRISETTYKQREALRKRYYARYEANLKKYENNYREYEHKRSSLSRRYGKLRAMYSAKSLTLIEDRFKKLRNTIVRYTKTMYKDTQHWFRRIGTGAGKQFKSIYHNVRRYLRMSNREAVRQFRNLYRNSRRWLNGSVNKYVRSLRYRYKRQRYYDRQLVKQARMTAKSMYKLPLGWITRETKDLIKNWKRQRHSYVVHNTRMTHAERAHLSTMSEHLRTFRDRFESLMDHLEDNIYDSWSKFWSKMKDRTGSGINEVQRPLNTGAMHINSFVRAFGETTSPMHEMPEVSYATGTGELRRPITRMVNATLNDGIDSPETGNQETVIKPSGQIEFPKGRNIQETLEPGTEVLNATETKLMGEMAHFAPNIHLSTGTGSNVDRIIKRQLSNNDDNSVVNNYSNPISMPNVPDITVNPVIHTEPQIHLASGTGIFGSIFGKMSGWLRNAINGDNSGMSYDSVWNQAKGRGYHKLLHVLQKVLSHSEQILSGFMGNAPTGYQGALGDITKGIYGQTTNQVDSWWRALMNLTNQTLNDSGSDSPLLNFAEKFGQGKHYIYGATGQGGAYDCSGFVQAVLRHYGVNAPRTSGAQINSFPHISRSQAHAGDLVGNGGHIGIVADNGAKNYYSAFSPSEGIRMFPLTSTYWDGGPMVFARVPKLNKLNGSSQLQLKGANRGLMRFVKRQESPMLKWIEKHLAPLLDANPGGYGVARWRPYVEKALKANGFSANSSQVNAWMHVIARESNGNPHAVNNWDSNAKAGTPSEGLVQTIGPTFKANAFPGHTNIFSGYDDLLAGIHYMAEKYGRGESAFARVSGPEGYAKGGHFHAGELMTVGERGEELMKPDFSGTVIPHNESKRILNHNNNSHPVNVNQTVNLKVDGDDKDIKQKIVSAMDNANNDLADKLASMFGFNEGGINI